MRACVREVGGWMMACWKHSTAARRFFGAGADWPVMSVMHHDAYDASRFLMFIDVNDSHACTTCATGYKNDAGDDLC